MHAWASQAVLFSLPLVARLLFFFANATHIYTHTLTNLCTPSLSLTRVSVFVIIFSFPSFLIPCCYYWHQRRVVETSLLPFPIHLLTHSTPTLIIFCARLSCLTPFSTPRSPTHLKSSSKPDTSHVLSFYVYLLAVPPAVLTTTKY